MNYTPIHVHTSFSILDAPLKIPDLVAKAKLMGFSGVGIADHGVMGGSLQFYKECRKNNINPIIGCELYVNSDRGRKEPNNRRNHHICLFAKTYEGYRDLIWLEGEACYNFYGKPRTNNRLILDKATNGNLICTTACIGSELFHLISRGEIKAAEELSLRYQEAFGPDNYYFELAINELLQQREYNNHLIRIGRKYGIPLVLGQDVHYLDKEDWYLQKLMFLIRDKKTIKDDNKNNNNMGGTEDENGDIKDDKWQYETKSLWLKSFDEVFECNKKFGFNYNESFMREILENTNKINSLCHIDWKFYDYKFPKHKHAENITSKELLLSRVKDGLKEKITNGQIDEKDLPIYLERIQKEIDVLTNKGRNFADYCLFVNDISKYIYSHGGSMGSGRGSSAGCLLFYILDVTKIDPIIGNLIFERFLNSARLKTDSPDCDCLPEYTLVLQPGGTYKPIGQLKVGDSVVSMDGTHQIITFINNRTARKNEQLLMFVLSQANNKYSSLLTSINHKLFVNENIMYANTIRIGDKLTQSNGSDARIIDIQNIYPKNKKLILTDITVSTNQSFIIKPYDTIEISRNFSGKILVCVNNYLCNIDIDITNAAETDNYDTEQRISEITALPYCRTIKF